MPYALVHYPEINTGQIDLLRNRYDPQADLIAPHITLIFPLPETVGEPALITHIEGVLRCWKPFTFRLGELTSSQDDCLFLALGEGATEFISLHEDLYAGLLATHLNPDITFVPHVTLGVFTGQPVALAVALEEARQLNLDYSSVMNQLQLVRVNEERTAVVPIKEFLLRSDS